MENKMVEPSNKKILIAVLVLLLIGGVVGVLVWGYVKRLSTGNLTSDLGQVEAHEYFEINVPDDWEYQTKETISKKNQRDAYTGPALSEFAVCSGANEGKKDSSTWDRFSIEVRAELFSGIEDFESFKKYFEADSESGKPSQVTLIDEIEIGATTALFVYQLAPHEKCDLQGFSAMAYTADNTIFYVAARGPEADYEGDLKDIFHSIQLK